MLKQQIESWAHQVMDRVTNGQPNEDALVELKAEWPTDFPRASRRLAGHANAARNQIILWIIGVDENAHAIPGAAHEQFADWMAQVTACFDDAIAPSPIEINIAHGGVTVVAIAFTTDRAPYVVKNPAGGGQPRDVPFREGTRTDSATRRQLLGILTPTLVVPQIEAIVIEAVAYSMRDGSHEIQVDQTFFLEQASDQTSTIPIHRCEVSVECGDLVIDMPCRQLYFTEDKTAAVASTLSVLTCTGSGYFELKFVNHFPLSQQLVNELQQHTQSLRVRTKFETARDRHAIEVSELAVPSQPTDESLRWSLNKWPSVRDSGPTDLLVTL